MFFFKEHALSQQKIPHPHHLITWLVSQAHPLIHLMLLNTRQLVINLSDWGLILQSWLWTTDEKPPPWRTFKKTFAEKNSSTKIFLLCRFINISEHVANRCVPVPTILKSLSRSPSGGPNLITVQFINQHSLTVWADLQVASLFRNKQTSNYIVSHCKLAFNSARNEFLFLTLCGPVIWPMKLLTAFLSIHTPKFNQPLKSSCCHICCVKQSASWCWVIFSGWYQTSHAFHGRLPKLMLAY